jgi:hypothetical protein
MRTWIWTAGRIRQPDAAKTKMMGFLEELGYVPEGT